MTPNRVQVSQDLMSVPEVTLLGPLATLLRYRRRLAKLCVLGALLGIASGLLRHAEFTSHASMMPEARHSSANVSGLAAQFGIALPTDEPGQSPQFYVDLLKSNQILDSLVPGPYRFDNGDRLVKSDLVDLLHAKGATQPLRRRDAMRRLDDLITASASLKTGVISFSVTAPYPALSQQIAQKLLAEVNTFNLERRQSQAHMERVFAQQQLAEASSGLMVAENRLADFLQQNRDFRSAPRLALEQERLSRDVSTRQELHNMLTQSYERARLDEVRDTPVITTLDAPDLPLLPDSRALIQRGVLGALFGVIISLLSVFWSNTINGGLRAENERDWFDAVRRDAAEDFRHPWRLLL